MTRSNLHVITGHDGSSWLEDILIEGNFDPKVRELLGGEPDRSRVLIPGVSQAFYKGSHSVVLVMTFAPDIDRSKAEDLVQDIRHDRGDLN